MRCRVHLCVSSLHRLSAPTKIGAISVNVSASLVKFHEIIVDSKISRTYASRSFVA